MTRFSLHFLGPIEFTAGERVFTNALTDKERALLGYLAMEAGGQQCREALGALLWPDRPERAARQNLRQALYHIRRATGDHHEDCLSILDSNNGSIQFKPHPNCRVDITEFKELLAAFRLHHPHGLSLCPACLAHLMTATALYRGAFMAGLSLRDAPQFDLWQIIHREALQQQMLEALSILAQHALAQGDYVGGSFWARRTIEIEPCQERAHCLLMRALAQQGRRAEALHQYELCSLILRRELAVEPSAKTYQLYNQIRDDLPLTMDVEAI